MDKKIFNYEKLIKEGHSVSNLSKDLQLKEEIEALQVVALSASDKEKEILEKHIEKIELELQALLN